MTSPDVMVIGGGFAGLSAASVLAARGALKATGLMGHLLSASQLGITLATVLTG